jgi:phosphoribosylformylglycinamidine synthase
MSMGERSPLALLNAPASGRMAVAEALTNLAAASVQAMDDIVLSANWMAACGESGEDAALFDTVKTVGMDFCPDLGIAIPVGKDSLSMKASWTEAGQDKSVTSPLSLIVSAFARVDDIRRSLTPQLDPNPSNPVFLLDLGQGKNRMGGSILGQVYNQLGNTTPDADSAAAVKTAFLAIQALNREGLLMAYHDRSDGGLLASFAEMMFAGHCGLDIDLTDLGGDLSCLFNEELGMLFQVKADNVDKVRQYFAQQTDLHAHLHLIGQPNQSDNLSLQFSDNKASFSRVELQRDWADTSYQMQSLRDNPDCALEEYQRILDTDDSGLYLKADFTPQAFHIGGNKPRMAVLREQGVNGQIEMAAAFDRAGFECVDVHMSDIIAGRDNLSDYQGLVACGGFSYGDVLGAGGGWAQSIRHNARAFDAFSQFFQNPNSFALGVCNGCQMLAQLKDIIPNADHWPRFVRNQSEQFEARYVMVDVPQSPSLFFKDMHGAQLPVVIAHGEGRAYAGEQAIAEDLVALRYVDHNGQATETYPLNPNGSPNGVTGMTTADGRFTIMMPHPERIFLSSRHTWLPDSWQGEESPWMQLFHNARGNLG